jgi:hypothetical protein
MFVRRELFNQLGGFPNGLEPEGASRGFGEDVLFGWRVRRAGASTGFCQEALAYHAVLPRGPTEFVAERARLSMFPLLAADVPELREAFFYRRFFHSKRSASFDLALAALALALAAESLLPLALTVPYLRLLAASASRWSIRGAPLVAVTEALADAVGAVALLRGSIRSGSLLL